jgi:hypothetical protein
LYELETRAAAHQENAVAERQPLGKELGTDDLVDSVVSPDVLAEIEQLAIGTEQASSVEAARPRKD